MTDLIICDGAIMNEILRITADGKLVSNNEALKPVIDYIEELETKLTKAVDVIICILANAPDGDDHRWSQLLDDAAAMLIELKV
jgi:hypothetical protein